MVFYLTRRKLLAKAISLACLLLALSGCVQNEDKQKTEKTISLTGAGASFPYPLYSRWIAEYRKIENVQIDYQSVGSGAGIQQITAKVIDFGGSDAPMTGEQLAAAPGEILHIPTVIGAVAITYNLPEIKETLRLTPGVLADIYLGKIKKWNEPQLAELNPQADLPAKNILVVHRSDGSGTTNIFTDYLSAVSPVWKQRAGKGTSVKWPVGAGAKGNEGVSRQVQSAPYSIGYVELSYVVLNKLPCAALQNRAGYFIKPSLESTTAAAAGSAKKMPPDLRVSIVNAPGRKAYPIAGYTYLLVYKEQEDLEKGRALAKFLWWALHEGEGYAKELLYAPLPEEVVVKAEEKIKSISYQGKPLLQE